MTLLGPTLGEPARPRTDPPPPLPVRVAEVARGSPDAVALVFQGRHLTYAHLRRRVRRLARRLRAMGVGPESLVGVSLERSPELVVSILGVLEAGGAYVPLDPSYPRERLELMAADSGLDLLVAEEGGPAAEVAPDRMRRIDPAAGTAPGGPAPAALDLCRRLAYVIYTSGSTGRPKGVQVGHPGLANLAEAQVEVFGLGPADRVLQFAPASFDASVFEIAMALSAGAALVLAPRDELLPGPGLAAFLERARITCLTLPPSVLAALPEGDLPALSTLVCAGEALPGDLVSRWGRGRRMFNAYGPTETTVWATVDRCRRGEDRPPIGRPVPGFRVAVVGPDLRPVPPGDPGELVLGGVAVARGYLGRPGLTAERFVPEPQSDDAAEPGARLYRTGDLARVLADGRVEFLGRIDHQVKIRGHRVEPGEAEAVLAGHPAVRSAAVVVRSDWRGEPRLVAYAVAPDAKREELRRFLAHRLPEHLRPAGIVLLPELPLLPNGKVDRRALVEEGPEPDSAEAWEGRGRPPRSEVEAALAGIWRDFLGVPAPRLDDDFFELGGHSLLVGRLVSRVRRGLGVELSPRAVFEGRTLEAVARAVEAASEPPLPPVERAPRDEPLPLTFPQERIWFVLELAPGSVAYNSQVTVRFEGPLSPPVLHRALAEVVRRHEAFRSRYFAVDGKPYQEPVPPPPVPLPLIDLRGLSGERREEAVARVVLQEGRRPFDVRGEASRPLLVRWRLILEEEGVASLQQVEHHFAHDGWAFAVVLAEIRALYEAFAEGRPSPLPEPVQIGDVAVWQRRLMSGERLREHLAYWTGCLAGARPVLELPADRPRPPVPSFRGDVVRVELPLPLARGVRKLARARGVTLFAVLLAGFEVLLSRYTGEEDLVVGSGNANRRTEEAEGVVGMLVNTLALRVGLGGEPSFATLLARVTEVLLGSQAYQDMPLDRLIDALGLPRDTSRNPLFQVLFSFHDSPVPDLELAGITGRVIERHNRTAKTDLNVVAIPRGEQRVGRSAREEDDAVTLIWEYSTDLFDRATMVRMVGHYRRLLSAAVAAPERPAAELPLLSAAERAQVLAEWNDTAVPYPRGRSIPELFAETAAQRQEAVAVRQGGRWWTYGELDALSGRLAARLAALGVGPETLVGLAAERSPELVAGLLGILKAGGAYLPLDPSYPAERLAFMLEDGRAPVLLAAEGTLPGLPAPELERLGTRVVSLEEALEADAGEPVRRARTGPRSLAYVLYTSGSTGRPKGVAVEHRSVVRLVRGASYARLDEQEVFLQLAPVPFDASTLEIWGPLLNGGRLEVFPPGVPSLEELGREVEASRVTTLWLTAGLFHRMVEEELPHLAGVGQLLAGGDVLSVPHVERVLAALSPGQVLVNGYGPTEGTTFTCCHRMVAGAGVGRESVPIGRPISSTRVYLVEPAPGRAPAPVPVGVPGELYLGGDGVARGYLARPALTAAAFVPDRFAPSRGGSPGARLYRTGDLARWLPGGELEFLGRMDHQVKLRGFRIELGEIESVLASHPGVEVAAVIVLAGPEGDGAGDRRLVAYLVPAAEAAPDPGTLRAFLAERLPEYMVPAAFVPLDELPLDPNGKVNRRALAEEGPAPDLRGRLGAGSVPPRGPVEEMVAGVWAEVLGRAGVGAHDDFFDLGGHSLAATRVVSRIRRLTGVELPLAELFERPTVAGIARAVEGRQRGPAAAAPPPLCPVSRARELPASFAASFSQERMWFLDRFEAERALYNVPAPVRIRGDLDAARLAGALRTLEEGHEGLRTVFAEAGSEEDEARVLQMVLPPAGRPLPLVDLGGLPGDRREAELGRLALAEVRRPFDLARGPLWRVRLARLASEDHALLVTAHHIVTDGWSVGVFFRELWALYAARGGARGPRPAELPPPTVQYPDFAVWQREWLRGPGLEREIDWWRDRLAGAPPVLELPTDRPRPRERSGRGGRLRSVLAPPLLEGLRALGDRERASLFMVLLAAFQAWLGRLSGQEDLSVGTPVANRTRSETEGIIGFFVNSLVLRTDLSGDPPFEELLGRVRTVALSAYARQDVPFEKLVEALEPDRRLEHTPLFQVSLVLQNAAPPGDPPPGLELEPLAVEAPTAKYDLTLGLEERDGGLLVRIAYSRDLFDPTTIRRMLRQLETLLEAAVADPGIRISELPLLAPAEAQALREWNDPPAPVASLPGETVQGAFRAWAADTPDAVALECRDERWTFRGLAGRAQSLARRLRSAGVGPEARVALLLEPSAAAVAAVLGVHEAGGAYVPLDPGYPPERLRLLIEDSGAEVVVTDRTLAGSLPYEGLGLQVLLVDEGEGVLRGGAGAGRGAPAGGPEEPRHLAYQVYTSGSTGRPKGVAVEHRHLLSYVRSVAARLGVEPGAALATVSPLTADLGNTSVFTALAIGGRLVVISQEDASDPEGLANAAARHRFDLLKIVPSHLAALLSGAGWERMLPARWLVLGGEALPLDLAERLAGALAGCRVINHYGPTETTVGVLTHRFDAPTLGGAAAAVPLGRPLAGCRVHLVDPRLRLVPVGVPGELAVAGSTVARGYPGRPGRSAEAFVPDPWAAAPGERLYRTGDQARCLAGGEVEFLGRIDGQVKVRGYRVEPGEVEARLLELPEVREAAVALAGTGPGEGEARLVAYYAPAPGADVPVSRLRRHLTEHLPEPLVPSAFVRLEELPRLPTGKVDRRALPAPSQRPSASPGRAAAPRSPLEELVADAWGEVLGRGGVGPHDDFFEVGGHSLLAIRVVSRLRRVTGVDLPVRALFERPTVAGQAEELGRVLGRAGGAGEMSEEPPILPLPRDRDLPASFAQERMWFVGRYGENRFLYNLPTPYCLRGGLEAPLLARALAAVVERHEALRTRFSPARDGEAGVVQRILSSLPVPLPVADLRRLPTRARRPEAERLAVAESEVPFDLDRGPLLRATLLRLGEVADGEEEDVLLLDLHHIISDAWSTGVVLRDLLTSYAAYREDRAPDLPELPVQYADFAAWQREWLSGEVLERQVEFWRGELDGAPKLLELPVDRPRPAVRTTRGDRQGRRLPPEQGRRLRGLARERGASPFMLLLAAFQTLLARLSGQHDVPVGVPVANRSRVETEGLVGFFVNALVLRGDLARDPPFEGLLEETRRRTLAAYAHQDLPFEKLVEELRPERDLSHTPLFQVVLNFHDARRATEAPGETGLETVPLAPRWRTSKFDLILNVREEAGTLDFRLEHNLDLFDRTTALRLLGCFETLLASAAAAPERRLSELAVLSAAERHQLLREWNDTAADPVGPEAALLHAPFEARAAERPDAVAVVAPGADGRVEHRTYGELDRRASRLARELTVRGAGPGTLVGVHLERSPAMAVAVLGVEKSGAAYVPLEAGWPAERIGWIVSERGVRHLVTESARLETVAKLGESLEEVVVADELPVEVPGRPPAEPSPGGPEDPAYVIFTSGSTGRPKGVVVRHRAAANLVSWVNRTFSVGPEDRLLFVTALSFDLSVYDLFGTLAAGGTVRLATAEELEDPGRQVEVMIEERITFWDSAPAALQRLAPLFPEPADLPETPALRRVFLSGDWVPLALPDRVRRSFPAAEVVALGGATEATVWSNFFRVGEVSDHWASIPYGRPIASARYHVLDGSLGPCPVGVAGDLYIAGGCLSSGYAGSPVQTAEGYLPDPFGGEPGGALYRTGDRARYFPDGNLEFLGRLDTQVKVRGFRIELGEIEAVLTEHPGVAEAVVLAREDVPGDRRLVAYWIPAETSPDGGEAAGPEALRRWVRRKLPEYMVPTGWVEREGWPLSPTGKLDRKALPAPHEVARAAPPAAAPAVPPRTALERAIAGVWREVLGVEAVSREASFFDLGGHSLLLARVHERLEGELSRELSMVELFRNPTVASLAKALGDEEQAEAPEREAPRRRPAGGGAVAVVGLAGRFPGARDVDELWENLRAGVESIRFFSDEELAEAGFDPEELRNPSMVKARGVLDDPDLFDAAFFGYSPREAEVIDPQQRLFLEEASRALEDAGHAPPATGRGARIGVFGGASGSDWLRRVEGDPELSKSLGAQQIVISNHPDYLPTRVSYKLHLTGPSVAVQTACSTSLVAVHLACRSLLEGECDLALAGGASLRGRQVAPYRYVEGGISSPDGHTRAFDARARGVVSGSGVGVVALKRLEDALADGDTIRAVVRGSAVNNDGALRAGFTAPSAEGQAEVIREALEAAGVDPATVSYVEAHGTATPMGDPIEVEGLKQAFGAGDGGRTCALGSIKTNVGHLDAAAGVAGLIKAVLALEHREIPPSLHFEEPNPEIDFEGSPFFVADRLLPWKGNGGPLRAGVSSFGIGGTNAHLVLEEAPAPEAAGSAEEPGAAPERGAELLVLSAKTEPALDRATEVLARHLREHPEVALADAAWTLQAGRRAFPWRRAVVAPSREDRRERAPDALEALDRRWSRTGLAPGESPRVAFLFPGQGAQFPGMGESLYREELVFREALDRCAEVLAPELGLDLRELLYPEADERFEEAEARLAETELTQPVLFAVEHALAELWTSWGIAPAALAGHSLGEYVAATRAGVFELEDALRLVAARGRLMGSRPGGAMLGVRLGEEDLAARLEADSSLALAAVNAPDACVVSGPEEAVAALRERLEVKGVGCRRLHTSHAFHSAMMEPVVEPFRELVARVQLRPPEIPFASNVTGTWITAEEATDPAYWARQLRSPVRFADGLSAVAGDSEEEAGGWALLEVGPGRTLTTLARRHRAAAGARALVPSTRHPRQGGSDTERVLSALGALWVAGIEVDWAAHHGGRDGRARRRRVPLPTYPFERRSFWVGDDRPRRDEPEPVAQPAGPPPPAELSETEAAVATAFRELLGVDAVGREDDFFEHGGSSLLAVQLGSRLRELLGVELPSDLLLQASSVGELAALSEERRSAAEAGQAPAASSCLVPLRKTGSRRALFLVHQVGGHVYSFRSLVKALPADQPVFGLRSPGLEPDEEPLGSVEAMAERYLELVRETRPRGPYRIGGASMGGMVALEMAHRLRDAGEDVELLVLMDTPCGDQMPPKPEDDAFLVAAVFAGRASLNPEEIRSLDPDERLRVGLERAREAGRLGEGFDLEQARRLLRVLRSNVEALYAYEPRPYRGGRIVLFRAEELRPGQTHRPELAWVGLARGGIDVTFVPGDHETMHDPPGSVAMAEHLEARLAARGAAGRGG